MLRQRTILPVKVKSMALTPNTPIHARESVADSFTANTAASRKRKPVANTMTILSRFRSG
jgi:hypothetical protein